MRVAFLSLLVVMSFATQARNGFGFGNPGFGGPAPRPVESCTFNLEKKFSDFSNRYYIVQTFKQFGYRACFEAESDCETSRRGQWDSWNYRCQLDQVSQPRPVESCTYQIEVGRARNRRLLDQEFKGFGFDACREAQVKCQDEHNYLRRTDRVGRLAECVKTSGRVPTPPRMETAHCTVELLAGRVGRPTGNVFNATATARSYQEAKDRACQQAMNQCAPHQRGALVCDIRN